MGTDYNKSAFPVLERGGNGLELTDTGMTLRDYFAAKAMQGVVASCTGGANIHTTVCAEWCYEMADAMLKARGEK